MTFQDKLEFANRRGQLAYALAVIVIGGDVAPFVNLMQEDVDWSSFLDADLLHEYLTSYEDLYK